MARLKVASLFCGCGGMDLGILGDFRFLGTSYPRSNFDIVYAVDNDKYCTQIYNANFTHPCEVRDVRDIVPDEIPDFDILVGGFPCQSFSISAQNPPRLGYKDERGMLFFEMVRILKQKKPRAFIAENVKGLLSANNKRAFPMILHEFSEAGYRVQYYLVNASRFGVPQKRERVIIIGFRDKVDEDNFKFSHYIPATSILRDVLDPTQDLNEKLYFSDKAVAGMMAVREKMNKGRAQDPDQACNTISAHLAKVSLNSTDPVLRIGNRFRRFSCREAARIQSFPDSFRLDVVSDIRQYKAIGNAVPPVLMWHIANSMQRAFEASDGTNRNTLKKKVQSVYSITMQNEMQGCVFEQEASYGHPPVSADGGEL
jgi:DNA (cytosine-5)-methyltransferase 1